MDYSDLNPDFEGNTFANFQWDVMMNHLESRYITRIGSYLGSIRPLDPDDLKAKYVDDEQLELDLYKRAEKLFNAAYPLKK